MLARQDRSADTPHPTDAGALHTAALGSVAADRAAAPSALAPSAELSRRSLVVRGSLALGGLGLAFLTGCKSGPQAGGTGEDLPGPVRPTAQNWAPPPPTNPTPRTPTIASTPPSGPAPGVLPRSLWTTRGPARPGDLNPMNGINRITIHHDGMDAFTSTSQSDSARRLEQIRLAHIARRPPFADIGYHYVIDPAGRVWEARNIRFQGAHVQDHNEHNLGVMVMGNFDLQQPTPAARSALDRFVAQQMRDYRVPTSRVLTHQELNPTACPGRNLQRYMLATRSSGGALRLAMLETDSELA